MPDVNRKDFPFVLDWVMPKDITKTLGKIPDSNDLKQKMNRNVGVPGGLFEAKIWHDDVPVATVRKHLLQTTLLAIEKAYAPQVFVDALEAQVEFRREAVRVGWAKPNNQWPKDNPRERAMGRFLQYIITSADYLKEEKEAFSSIARAKDPTSYAKSLYERAVLSANMHLEPQTFSSGYVYQSNTTSETRFWGKEHYARLVASQIYLLSRTDMTWQDTENLRNEAIAKAPAEKRKLRQLMETHLSK